MPGKKIRKPNSVISSTATPGIKAPDKHEVPSSKQPDSAASGHSHTGGGGKGLTTDKTIEQLKEHLASEQNVLGNTNIFTK